MKWKWNNTLWIHIALWLLVLLILMWYQGFEGGLLYVGFNNFLVVICYVLLVYFNLNYLIPNYLLNNKFLIYSGLLLLTSLVVTTLRELMQFLLYVIVDDTAAKDFLLSTLNLQLLLAFLVAGTSTIFKITSDWARQSKERQELQTRTMQSELRFLKSQINPHFLFNTLNNLYALTLKKDDKAPEIVLKLSEMMRYMLYECNEKRVPLEKEVNYIRNYLDLEQLRQGGNVKIKFEINGQIKDQQIAPLMFIPFLENSFKHGINHVLSKGYVNVILNVDERHVNFFIENNKADMVAFPNQKRAGGIGLVNVKQRLDLLYPSNYALEIDDNPKSYAVNLLIDL